jgi:mono/diheme cytochrome c family protein
MRSFLTWLLAASLVLSGAVRGFRQDPQHLLAAAQPPVPAESLVRTYCVTCHSDRLKTGGLSLQGLDPANVPEHADVWEKVARKLRSGEMPPSNVRSRPDPRDAAALVAHVESTLDRAAAAHPNPGRAPVHRRSARCRCPSG